MVMMARRQSADSLMDSFLRRFARESEVTELKRRIAECKRYGHMKPDKTDNTCNYCFRKLSYSPKEIAANQEEIDFIKGLEKLLEK